MNPCMWFCNPPPGHPNLRFATLNPSIGCIGNPNLGFERSTLRFELPNIFWEPRPKIGAPKSRAGLEDLGGQPNPRLGPRPFPTSVGEISYIMCSWL